MLAAMPCVVCDARMRPHHHTAASGMRWLLLIISLLEEELLPWSSAGVGPPTDDDDLARAISPKLPPERLVAPLRDQVLAAILAAARSAALLLLECPRAPSYTAAVSCHRPLPLSPAAPLPLHSAACLLLPWLLTSSRQVVVSLAPLGGPPSHGAAGSWEGSGCPPTCSLHLRVPGLELLCLGARRAALDCVPPSPSSLACAKHP